MRSVLLAGALCCVALLTTGASRPDWVFPTLDTSIADPPDDGTPKHVPGSAKSFSAAEVGDQFNLIDWFPDSHPAAPAIVTHGQDKTVRACGTCHQIRGSGHPDNADLAALPAAYILEQLGEFKRGARSPGSSMAGFAAAVSDENARAAAAYFSSLPPAPWTRVTEVETVPKSYVNKTGLRLPLPNGGMEPLGHRIIELPEDPDRMALRDPNSGFVAYVPAGAIAQGKTLVTEGGGGKTIACAICHGPRLDGLGDVPRLAGRFPSYVARQLYQIQSGARAGGMVELMKAVVRNLDDDDIVAISAYIATQKP